MIKKMTSGGHQANSNTIETNHVFIENDQVFVRERNVLTEPHEETDIWFPVNFYWRRDMELRKFLLNQSK